jgi:hypothetical protein
MPTAPIFPTPTLAPGQIDLRGGFEGGLGPWEERIGSRVIARTVYHSGTGALQVIADEVNSRGDYTAISGQCVDLSGLLADWPLVNGERHITVEGYFKTDAKVASLSFGLTFHESTQCAGGAPLAPSSQSIEGGMDWTQVVVYGSIPENAKSVDIFMVLVGMDSSATMYVDDILAYP